MEDVKTEIDARYDRMIRNERALLEEMGRHWKGQRAAARGWRQMPGSRCFRKDSRKMAEKPPKAGGDTQATGSAAQNRGADAHHFRRHGCKHIPEALRNTVAEFLKDRPRFPEDSKAAWKWREQTAVLAARMEEYNLSGGQMQVDAYIIAQLRTIGEDIAARIQTAGSSIREMKLTELQKLDETLDLLGAAIRNSDRILAEERSTRLAAVAQQSMEELRQRKAYQGRMKGMNEPLNLQQLDAFLAEKRARPQNSIFKNLRSGLDHKIDVAGSQRCHGTGCRAAAGQVYARQIEGAFGRTGQYHHIYPGKRNADQADHRADHGIIPAEPEGGGQAAYLSGWHYRGRIYCRAQKSEKQSRKQVSEADIDAITEMLTPAQKRFVGNVAALLRDDRGANRGNRVSLSLWGHKEIYRSEILADPRRQQYAGNEHDAGGCIQHCPTEKYRHEPVDQSGRGQCVNFG